MSKALGSTPESSHLPGLYKLSPHVKGDAGLLCSPRPPTSLLPYLQSYTKTDFARSGTPSTSSFTLPAGVVYSQGGQIAESDDQPVSHSSEVLLRKWGLPTRLEKGKVMLDGEYVVCEEGSTLNSHQTALLKFFGVAMAEFRVGVVAYWSSEGGEVVVVEGEDGAEGMEE